MTIPRILFVEDNRISSLLSCLVLRDLGYEVLEAFCAAEALEIIEKHEPLSALITDINLGTGGDGFDVARRARAAYPHLPVVYISAAAAARFAAEGVECSEFIDKPFHPALMIEALGRTMPTAAA
uniref:Response regulator receiver protein n=1 Tax=Caulobacter sp. (strain K31) TaxID=366602 RepID=B0T4T1_CAUSK